MRPHLIAGLGVAAAAAGFATGLPSIDAAGGYSGLSPRFLPTIVTLGLAVCAVLLIARRASVPDAPDDADRSDPRAPSRPVARLATLLAGLAANLALIGTLGFVACATLLMILVARAFGSRRPLRDGLVGLALALPLWLVFTRLLGLSLPLMPVLGR